jgi:phosphoribosylamine--glycine ligase
MKILLVGSGGREHAIALKLKSSATPVELFATPGSDAIGELGVCLPYDVDDVAGILGWCDTNRPELVVVGPEAALVAGVADPLRELGIAVFGHGKETAQLEGSKSFSKAFMTRHGIPCASDHTVTDFAEGEAVIRSWRHGYPIVLKADGLAAGKGVVLATSEREAMATLRAFLDGQFGDASRKVVLEEPLVGMELSLHVLVDVDGDHASYAILPPCQDHKRIFDGDRGPNTGGMGAFGPIPFLKPEDLDQLRKELVEPTVRGCRQDGLQARGVFFLGVMWTPQGPKLLEYNVRFGDPETQVLMQLLDEDLPRLLLEVAQGRLQRTEVKLHPGCAITVVLAAEGYPETAKKGVPIHIGTPGLAVIHAGTQRRNGQWVTNGGRVLNLATKAPDLEAARSCVDAALPAISWPGMQFRRDIGLRALKHALAGKGVQDPW